jgi:two-component system response regulator FixJ
MSHHRTVYVIDRDLDTRRSLSVHLGMIGAEAWPFASGAEFLGILDHLLPACVLLDLDGGDPPGLELLSEIIERCPDWPVIGLSTCEEVGFAVDAMKLGALDFLCKPIGPAALAGALAPAWQILQASTEESEVRRSAQERVARLTAREIDISISLLGGWPNKTVAHELGISVRTVEMHRAHIMAKLGVRNLAEAAVLATQAGLLSNKGAFAPDRTQGSTALATGAPGPPRTASAAATRFLSRRAPSRRAG